MKWGVIEGPPLDSILRSTARLNLWAGPVRSAKTVHSLIRWLEFVKTCGPGDLYMIGKTEDTLERNILAPLKLATDGEFTYSKGQGKAWVGQRTIYLHGANNKEAEGKLRGGTWVGCYGDEVSTWPMEVFKQVGLRLSAAGASGFFTTNPDGPYHWLKTDYMDREGEIDLRTFTWPLEVNTYLPGEYIENLKREYVGLWYQRFILGLWVAAEGAVYDFFDPSQHVIDACPRATAYDVAVDYGTSNATAFGLFGIGPAGSLRAWLEREYYHSGRDQGQKTDVQYADDFDRWLGGVSPRQVIVDPSAASFKLELRKRGYQVRDANNSVLDGIRTTAKMLQKGEYKLHSSCKESIKGFSAYLWDAKAQARGEDKPLKENDHTCDMQRYELHTLFGRGESHEDASLAMMRL